MFLSKQVILAQSEQIKKNVISEVAEIQAVASEHRSQIYGLDSTSSFRTHMSLITELISAQSEQI